MKEQMIRREVKTYGAPRARLQIHIEKVLLLVRVPVHPLSVGAYDHAVAIDAEAHKIGPINGRCDAP
ncbi:hypothetical protein D3C80_1262630 [compost metagenome]